MVPVSRIRCPATTGLAWQLLEILWIESSIVEMISHISPFGLCTFGNVSVPSGIMTSCWSSSWCRWNIVHIVVQYCCRSRGCLIVSSLIFIILFGYIWTGAIDLRSEERSLDDFVVGSSVCKSWFRVCCWKLLCKWVVIVDKIQIFQDINRIAQKTLRLSSRNITDKLKASPFLLLRWSRFC